MCPLGQQQKFICCPGPATHSVYIKNKEAIAKVHSAFINRRWLSSAAAKLLKPLTSSQDVHVHMWTESGLYIH